MTDLKSLLAAVAAGSEPDYLFFWGHTPHGPGIGKHVLSQWWPAHFVIDGESFGSAEHYMMAGKARLFGDQETRARVMAASSPAEAKKLGRKVRGFDETAWAQARFALVVAANAAKFGQDAALRGYLLQTGEAVLVEASPVDRVWGIGMAAADPRARKPAEWNGLNLLGFALMQARAALAEKA